MPTRYESPQERDARLLAEYYDTAADRRILLTAALCAYLKGEPMTGANAIFRGCGLADFKSLGDVAMGQPSCLAGTSSSEWAGILRDTFERLTVEHYDASESTCRRLTRRVDLGSVRTTTLARPGEFPALEKVGPSGIVLHAGVGHDGYENLTLARFSRIYSASHTLFTNDDRIALGALPEQAGTAARFAEDEPFFDVLAANAPLSDGVPLFHGSHNNLMTGAAIDATQIGLGSANMRKQTAPGGALLNLSPRYLLVGPDNEVVARAAIATMTAGTTPPLELLVDPHLAGEWYLWSDPVRRPALVRGVLNGQDSPSVESRIGWESDAVEWRVSITHGVAPYDWRCVVKNPGV